MRSQFLTLEGYEPDFSAGSRRSWESSDGEYYYDPNLGGFFKRLKKAVTPPRAIRKMQLKTLPKLVVTTAKKAIRYAGAATVGVVLTASQRKKAFGLSSKESKQFETGAKVTRGIAAAVAVAAVAYVAAPAVGGGAAAGGAASGGTAAATSTAAATPAWQALLMKGGAMLVKSQAAGLLYRLTANKSGQQTMESYNLADVPAAAEMPDGQPVPVEPIHSEGSVFAPYVAGSGGLRPGGEEAISRRAGESEPYDPAALLDQATAMDESSIDPGVMSDPESIGDKLTPMQDAVLRQTAFDSGSIRDLLSRSRLSRASEARRSLSTSDGSYSLRGLLDGVRYGVIKRTPRFCPRAQPTSFQGPLTALVRRSRSQRQVSRSTANIALEGNSDASRRPFKGGRSGNVPAALGFGQRSPVQVPGHLYANVYGRQVDITPTYVDGWPTRGQYDTAKARMAEITLNPDPNIFIADRNTAPAYERIIRDYELFMDLPEVTRKGIEVNQRRADAPGSKPSGRFAAVKTAAEYVKKDESVDPFTSLFSLTQRQPST